MVRPKTFMERQIMKQRLVLFCAAILALMASSGLCQSPNGGLREMGSGDVGGKAGTRPESTAGGAGGESHAGAFKRFENGIIFDETTRLEWLAGPDQHMNWNQAKIWTEELSIGGGGWRMPTRDELQTLYSEGSGSRNMTPFLQTSGWLVWSGETRDYSTAWIFNFYYNGFELYDRRNDHGGNRAFAVRPRE